MNKKILEETNEQIRTLVKEKLKLDVDISEIEDEFLFGVGNGFDSTSLLEFILELEDVFNIIIPDDDLKPDNFASISRVTKYVVRMREE